MPRWTLRADMDTTIGKQPSSSCKQHPVAAFRRSSSSFVDTHAYGPHRVPTEVRPAPVASAAIALQKLVGLSTLVPGNGALLSLLDLASTMDSLHSWHCSDYATGETRSSFGLRGSNGALPMCRSLRGPRAAAGDGSASRLGDTDCPVALGWPAGEPAFSAPWPDRERSATRLIVRGATSCK